MNIVYTPNPLQTRVELDDHDQEVFRLKIRIKELEDRLFSTHFELTVGGCTPASPEGTADIPAALERCDPEYFMSEDGPNGEPLPTRLDKRVDQLFTYYSEALLSSHCGDCTCVPCSCLKCRAEDILGVNTLGTFPGKHELNWVNSAFKTPFTTLVEALEFLRTHEIEKQLPPTWRNSSQAAYESFMPRWQEQQRGAYDYLLAYSKKHPELTPLLNPSEI